MVFIMGSMLVIAMVCEGNFMNVVLSKGILCVIEMGEMGRKYWVGLVKLLVRIG